ncbi:MAG TPA: prohead protease, partial [Candidatus Omnitrophota bacterium]|nr:prohead protease [Candidatus Omnitrophota bacterium]
MRNYLSKIDKKTSDLIRMIGQEADRKGISAYVVGGIVRDILIKEKNFDLDIVVDGDTALLAEALAKQGKGRVTLHKSFGTASVKMPEGWHIDFAAARKEQYVRPGALPTVQAGSLEDD